MTAKVKVLRYGTTHADGSLDYGMHIVCQDEMQLSPELTKAIVMADLWRNADNGAVGHMLWDAVRRDDFIMDLWSDAYAASCGTTRAKRKELKKAPRIDAIAVELGRWTVFRYLNGGSWPSVCLTESLDDSDCMTYRQQSKDVAVWDGSKWCDPNTYRCKDSL